MEEQKKISLTGNQLVQLAEQEKRKLDEITRRVASLQNFRNEMMAASDALVEIEKAKKGEKILVNLGAGIYLETGIEKNNEAITALAGNIFQKKNSKEIMKKLQKQIDALNKSISKIAEEQQKALSRLNQVEQVLNAGRNYIQNQSQNNR